MQAGFDGEFPIDSNDLALLLPLTERTPEGTKSHGMGKDCNLQEEKAGRNFDQGAGVIVGPDRALHAQHEQR